MSDPRPILPDYRVPALDKGLDVLELLAGAQGALGMSQIAAALGRSVQEVYRTVLTLERRGYLERREDEGFRLTLRLFDLAARQPALARLLEAAAPVLTPLAAALGQVVTLAVRDGAMFRIVALGESPAPVGLRVRLGTTRPLTDGASGRVLLAFLPRAERAAALTLAGLEAEPPRLAAIRAAGGEERAGETLSGVVDVSFPVMGAGGRVAAALTMPFLVAPMAAPVPLRVAADRLHAAAGALSAAMGGAGAPLAADFPAGLA